MANKLFDAVVKTGEYTDAQGQTKGRYENIGSVMQSDNGIFMVLKRTFNAAGVPNPDCKDSVIVSFFEQNNNSQQQAPQQQQGGYNQPQQQQGYQQQQGGFAPQQGQMNQQQGNQNPPF